MKKLNYTQVNGLIGLVKSQVGKNLKINVFRAIKEFLLKHKEEIYEYNDFYFIGDKWVYNPKTPKEIQPLPNKCLFCGWCDTNDDTYHYWLKDKKVLTEYGITYTDYKSFNSTNWFIVESGKLYINCKYYEKTATL